MKIFYCLNCFRAYTTKNKLEAHKKICKNHEYCHVAYEYEYHEYNEY